MGEKPFNRGLDQSQTISEAKSRFRSTVRKISIKLKQGEPYSLEYLEAIFDFRREWNLASLLLDKGVSNPHTQWEETEDGRFKLVGVTEKEAPKTVLTDIEKSRLAEMRQKITEEPFKSEIIQQRLELTWLITSHLIRNLVKAGELLRISVGAGTAYKFPKKKKKQNENCPGH